MTFSKSNFFTDEAVRMDLLRERAFNLRWATLPEDVIPLTAADPDFPVAPEIREAIKEYADGGVFSYGPGQGLPSFRKVIAQTMRERRGLACTWEQILPTNSAAFGMFLVARFALEPGDEALIFDPVDFLFKTSVQSAGGIPVLVPLDRETRTFDPEHLESLISPKTKLLCICNPHNPMGRVLTEEELRVLGDIAVKHNLWIMSDEIWSDIVFPPHTYHSIAALDPEYAQRTLSVYGFSKSFGLAGLRVGFIVAPDREVFSQIVEMSQVETTAFGVSTLSQVAAQAAYEKCWYWVEDFLKHLKGNRDYATERLNLIPGVKAQAPEGCYVIFPDITDLGKSSEEMAAFILEKAKVAVVPGAAKWFGPGAEGHIRICFSTSRKILTEGLDRIEAALSTLV